MSKKQKSTSTATPWSAAQPMLRDIIGEAQGMGVEGFAVSPYEGARVAQYSPTTMSGIEALSSPSAATPAAEAALLDTLNMDARYRDFDLIKEMAADDVKAQLAGTFSGGGIDSGLAQDTYTRAMTESLAGLEFDAYNRAQDRQLSAIGMAPSIAAAGRADAGGLLTAGGLLDAQAQANIDADMAAYYEGENTDIDAIQRYAQLGMGLGGMGGSSSATTPVPLSDQLSNIGTIAGAIGTGLSWFSDRRLKKNIAPDGSGYSFSYIWSPVRHHGFMSDERPERVVGQWMGFDVVAI